MNEKRYDVKVVSANGELFAAYSKNFLWDSCHYKRTWERLSGSTSSWKRCHTDLKLAREGCRLVETRDILYFVGGDRRQRNRFSVSEFHLVLNSANSSPPQEFTPVRRGFAAAALGGFIYLVGGCTADNELVTSFQRYDPGRGVAIYLEDPPSAPGYNVQSVIIESTVLPEPQPGPSRI